MSSISSHLQLFSICYQADILVSLALPLIFIGEAANSNGASNGAVLYDSTIQCNGPELQSARLIAIIASFHVAIRVPSISI